MSEQRKIQFVGRAKAATGIFAPTNENFMRLGSSRVSMNMATTGTQTEENRYVRSQSNVQPAAISSSSGIRSHGSAFHTSSASIPYVVEVTSASTTAKQVAVSSHDNSLASKMSPVIKSVTTKSKFLAKLRPCESGNASGTSSILLPDHVIKSDETYKTVALSRESGSDKSTATSPKAHDYRISDISVNHSQTDKVDVQAVTQSETVSAFKSTNESCSDDSEHELQIVVEESENSTQSSTSKAEPEMATTNTSKVPPVDYARQSNDTKNVVIVKVEPGIYSTNALETLKTGSIQNARSGDTSTIPITSKSRSGLSDSTAMGSSHQKISNNTRHITHTHASMPQQPKRVITSSPASAFVNTGKQQIYGLQTVSSTSNSHAQSQTGDQKQGIFVISESQARADADKSDSNFSHSERGNSQPGGNPPISTFYLPGAPISGYRHACANSVPQTYFLSSNSSCPVTVSTSQALQSSSAMSTGMGNVVLVDHRNVPSVIAVSLPQATGTVTTVSSTNTTSTYTGGYESGSPPIVVKYPRNESPQVICSPITTSNNTICPPRPSILRKRYADGSRKNTPTKELISVSPSPENSNSNCSVSSSKTQSVSTQNGTASVAVAASSTAYIDKAIDNVESVETTEYQAITPRKKPRKQAVVSTEDKYASNLPCDSTDSSETEEGDEITDLNECNVNSSTLADSNNSQVRTSSKSPVENYGNLIMLRNKKRISIVNGYKNNNKAAHNHFQRYSDVRRRDDKKSTMSEICTQRGAFQRLQGWRIYHLKAQLEDMAKVEQGIYSKICRLQECMATYRRGRNTKGEDLSMMHELLQGNIQRCRLVIEQVDEVKTLMHKLLEHKALAAELLKKQADRQQAKKKN